MKYIKVEIGFINSYGNVSYFDVLSIINEKASEGYKLVAICDCSAFFETQPPSDDKQEWFDVKDKLPEEGNRIFIFYRNSYGKYWRDIAIYTEGGKIEFDDDNEDFPECFDEKAGCSFLSKGFWVEDGDGEKCYQRNNVTHWRYLPKAPESVT